MSDDVLEDVLKPEDKQKERSDLEVLKELFSIKNVETKTELSPKQIVLINQKRIISKLLGWQSLDESLDDFMLLMISNQRKGRAEFVDGFKSDREQKQAPAKGFFSGLTDRLKI